MKKLIFWAMVMAVMTFAKASSAMIDIDTDKLKVPYIDELYLVVIKDPDARALALEKGEVDLIGDIASPAVIRRLSNSGEKVTLSMAKSFHALSMGMNLRRQPWNRTEIRKAVNLIVPRNKLVRELFGGFSEPLYSFLPPVSPYCESDVSQQKYDPEKAREILRSSGWRWNEMGILISPGSDEPMKPVSILSPTASSAPTTAELAARIADEMTALGIPAKSEPTDFSNMLARLDVRDFDCYVMAWSLTRDPDVLYSLYHSSMDVTGGYNIPGVRSIPLDAELEKLRYAPDEKSALEAAYRTQKLLDEIMPVIPVYSRSSVGAIRKEWSGAVATPATSVDSIWTLLSVHMDSGRKRPFKMAIEDDPRALNPLTSSSATAWKVLGMIYESLIDIDPTTLKDRPGLAESWQVETLKTEGKEVTELKFRLRKGLLWQDGTPLTSEDPAETIRFISEHEIPRFFDSVSDVSSVETPDATTVIVRMRTASYWHLHHIAGLPIIPAKILKRIKDWKNWQPMVQGELIGSGPFSIEDYRPGEYVRFTSNGRYWRSNR